MRYEDKKRIKEETGAEVTHIFPEEIEIWSTDVWNPQEKSRDISDKETIDIDRPPCGSNCKHWKPISIYRYDPIQKKNIADGTIMCHSSMRKDFSCFELTDEAKEKLKVKKAEEDNFSKYVEDGNYINDELIARDYPEIDLETGAKYDENQIENELKNVDVEKIIREAGEDSDNPIIVRNKKTKSNI